MSMEAIGPSIMELALLKGGAIAFPFLVGALWSRRRPRINKELAYVCAILVLFVVFSPLSLRGLLADYLVWMVGGTVAIASWINHRNDPKQARARSIAISVIVFLIYVPVKSTFGSFLVRSYVQDGLHFKMYEVPDPVVAPGYFMEVIQPWTVFEHQLTSTGVRPYCKAFKYDREQRELVVRDTCGGELPY